MGRKSTLFKKTLNTRYFGRKATFFDDTVSNPKHMHNDAGVTIIDNSINDFNAATLYADGVTISSISDYIYHK